MNKYLVHCLIEVGSLHRLAVYIPSDPGGVWSQLGRVLVALRKHLTHFSPLISIETTIQKQELQRCGQVVSGVCDLVGWVLRGVEPFSQCFAVKNHVARCRFEPARFAVQGFEVFEEVGWGPVQVVFSVLEDLSVRVQSSSKGQLYLHRATPTIG